MEALTPGQRRRHAELAKELRPLIVEFKELADGYAAVFRSSQDLQSQIKDFMTLEKRCCPFLELSMKHRGDSGGDYVVEITGPGNIKPFIRAEFGIDR